MSSTFSLRSLLSRKVLVLPLMAMALAGCAQLSAPGYYDTPRDSTQSDARIQAQGRSKGEPPSQLRFGFGADAKSPDEAAQMQREAQIASARVPARPLAEAKTYLGTVPCLNEKNMACPASRITLTLAPTGEWRARSISVTDASAGGTRLEQGCWEVIGSRPLRIMLRINKEGSKADLSFVNDNVLRINSLDGAQPTLDYHLTRQADVDPIKELADRPALSCGQIN
ncbi:hypothetical protein [Pusillimonas sp. ANT_WB101]|uniref:hypothetical protein n=1 Tax=Pusillimonas sp. ANT_WB101 TaxID=2597356 RepID=UPI0011EDEE35|nr:hypothetical protein [Pusillimonas sp. ANT_WB101]KAA0890672.1 hypothetical protein FQ179_13425 [Pusillimonas sp. ANT_WB101]